MIMTGDGPAVTTVLGWPLSIYNIISIAMEARGMYKYDLPQKVIDITRCENRGQPGEWPTVMKKTFVAAFFTVVIRLSAMPVKVFLIKGLPGNFAERKGVG